jgi:hypothetical protein
MQEKGGGNTPADNCSQLLLPYLAPAEIGCTEVGRWLATAIASKPQTNK